MRRRERSELQPDYAGYVVSIDYVREDDIQLYAQVLREIKLRTDAATEVLARVPPTRFNADLAAVELRIVLELVLLGSLVTNRTEIERVASALHKHDCKRATLLRGGRTRD